MSTNSISEGDIFIYLCSAQLTSFEIDLISKEINCAEQEYMNMSPSLIELATPRNISVGKTLLEKEYLLVALKESFCEHSNRFETGS